MGGGGGGRHHSTSVTIGYGQWVGGTYSTGMHSCVCVCMCVCVCVCVLGKGLLTCQKTTLVIRFQIVQCSSDGINHMRSSFSFCC